MLWLSLKEAKCKDLLCSKIWERDLIEEEIQSLMSAFGDFAKVSCTHNVSIISLICNVAKTSSILERVRPCPALYSLLPHLC